MVEVTKATEPIGSGQKVHKWWSAHFGRSEDQPVFFALLVVAIAITLTPFSSALLQSRPLLPTNGVFVSWFGVGRIAPPIVSSEKNKVSSMPSLSTRALSATTSASVRWLGHSLA